MSNEISKIRSKNNNVFSYCSYWGSWSRILFHDAGGRGMLKMRQEYGIPNSDRTIEVNVLCSIGSSQERNAKVVIRSHHTPLLMSAYDRMTMELPLDVSQKVLVAYEPDIYSLIMHADLLKYIDFKKLHGPKNNGGCELEDCLVDGLTLHKLNGILAGM